MRPLLLLSIVDIIVLLCVWVRCACIPIPAPGRGMSESEQNGATTPGFIESPRLSISSQAQLRQASGWRHTKSTDGARAPQGLGAHNSRTDARPKLTRRIVSPHFVFLARVLAHWGQLRITARPPASNDEHLSESQACAAILRRTFERRLRTSEPATGEHLARLVASKKQKDLAHAPGFYDRCIRNSSLARALSSARACMC